ncbi:ABC transporter substrate-binding protein, partial [Candidatus Nomurabacteria bacterium]|nr:ABC transporter substrate-binding protein [Candidatus Nomurabacteria bacterium]
MYLKISKTAISILLMVALILLPIAAICDSQDSLDSGYTQEDTHDTDIRDLLRGVSYIDYLKEHSDKPAGTKEEVIDASSYAFSDMAIIKETDYESMEGISILTPDSGTVKWEFQLEDHGMYQISILYYPYEGSGSSIERSLYINDEIPFNEARYITLSRIWNDEGTIKRDIFGNDIRPGQTECPEWTNSLLEDSTGYNPEPLLFYFAKGKNTIALKSIREPLMIKQIMLKPVTVIPNYLDLFAEYEKKGYSNSDAKDIVIQAEETYRKSSNSIYPLYDRSSPITQPQDVSKIRLNTIGREKWSLPGQWLEWKIPVSRTGLYRIAFRCRQDVIQGAFVSRKLTIDGQIPFSEAASISFRPGNSWKVEVLGNETDEYLIYLEEGEHLLRLETVLGEMAEILRETEDAMYFLNSIYRSILMITGPNPDKYRNYNFEKLIPGVLENMKEQAAVLYDIVNKIVSITGEKGQNVVLLERIAFQLSEMYRDPETIAASFTNFKGNVGSLGTWILTTSQQPLELDYIIIQSPESPLPKSESGFWELTWFYLRNFFMSFFIDYSAIGEVDPVEGEGTAADTSKQVNVWIETGRDQAAIIREMLDDSFVPENGIRVDLELVGPGTLLPSTLAGVG